MLTIIYDYIHVKLKTDKMNQSSLGVHTRGIQLSGNGEVNDLPRKKSSVRVYLNLERSLRQGRKCNWGELNRNFENNSNVLFLKLYNFKANYNFKASAPVFLLFFIKIYV